MQWQFKKILYLFYNNCKRITQWQPLITLSMSGEGELKKEP